MGSATTSATMGGGVLRVVSLFSGCGGMDLGFESTGLARVVWGCERWRGAHATYRRNFPHAVLDTRRIEDVPAAEIPDCDGVIGGPPCQAFSVLGHGRDRDRGLADPRGRLLFEFVRVVGAKSPAFFVMENVPALAQAQHRPALEAVLGMFRRLGYAVRAACCAAPTTGWRRAGAGSSWWACARAAACAATRRRPPWTRRPARCATPSGTSRAASSRRTAGPRRAGDRAHEHVPHAKTGLSRWFMTAQRVRGWDEPSYTIPASVTSVAFHRARPKCSAPRARGPAARTASCRATRTASSARASARGYRGSRTSSTSCTTGWPTPIA